MATIEITRKIRVPSDYKQGFTRWWTHEYWKFGWGVIIGMLIMALGC